MVEAKSYTWDVALLARSDEQLLAASNLLEPLKIQGSAYDDLPESYRTPYFAGVDIYSTVLAYRTDKMKHPQASWKDLWNVADFLVRRPLRNNPLGKTDIALMAGGVQTATLYTFAM